MSGSNTISGFIIICFFYVSKNPNRMKSKLKKPVVVVGYSGHSYVIIDILLNAGRMVTAYCDSEKKERNPYHLNYLGKENEVIESLQSFDYFIGIGHNGIRSKVQKNLVQFLGMPINAIHPSAVISASVELGKGVMIAANATINPVVTIGQGVICNTSCSIDHECAIEDFVHIAPGAVLCGNVKVGAGTFVGANTVVKQGITIGKNVTIGAGSVIIRDVPDNLTVVGNPQRILSKEDIRKLAA
jgi:sugar O-acyltransferase (sialic acid O-acetyltransferase NeuD family)